jgi:hypothetical protein
VCAYLISLLYPSNFLTFTFLQVFGLGNKTYEHFNEMGKIADTKLEQMGGTRISALGQGDDDGRFVVVVVYLFFDYFFVYFCSFIYFCQSRRGLYALARDILATCVRGNY